MKKLFLALALLLSGTAHAGSFPRIDADTTVRAAAILTTSFVGTTAVEMPFSSQANCLVSFTIGSLTTLEIKAQFSQNGTDFFDETERQSPAITAATGIDEAIGVIYPKLYQLNDTATVSVSTPVLYRYFRLALRGTGTVTSSSATVRCATGAL